MRRQIRKRCHRIADVAFCRSSVRRAVYLPAVVATRFNPDLKVKYEQLVSTGKCKKLAIAAVMRKLIVMANALLRDVRKWNEYPA